MQLESPPLSLGALSESDIGDHISLCLAAFNKSVLLKSKYLLRLLI